LKQVNYTFRFVWCFVILAVLPTIASGDISIAGLSPWNPTRFEFDTDNLGQHVSIGVIEQSQTGNSFLPNFNDDALKGMHLTGVFSDWTNFEHLQYSTHATEVVKILCGKSQNEASAFVRDSGILPLSSISLYSAPWFIFNKLGNPYESITEDVLSISWGASSLDSITQWWQNGFDASVEKDNTTIVAACGNGGDLSDINKPAMGYNLISVGTAGYQVNYDNDFLLVSLVEPDHLESSFGPTLDGRSKPDVVALGVPKPLGITPFDLFIDQPKVYTSYSAPQVAGLAGSLINEARKRGIVNGDNPLVIKSLIINGAVKLPNWHKGTDDPNDDEYYPLDSAQGAGIIDAKNSLAQLVSVQNIIENNIGWDFGTISLDRYEPKSVIIYDLPEPLLAGETLKATLNWFRHYQTVVDTKSLKPFNFYKPEPLNHLALELWQTNAFGELTILLSKSASYKDNLQHIYYHCKVTSHIALLVRVLPHHRELMRHEEQFALTFTAQDN
jgi:hypothetical protein